MVITYKSWPLRKSHSSNTCVFHVVIFVFFVSGNAVLTCKSNDNVKVFTIRGTAFEAAQASGGGAASENGNKHLVSF